MRDDDETERRPEDYLWQPGEREQVEREMAERQRQIQRDEMLAWCEQRNIGAESVVTKSAPVTQRAAAAAPATLTREWQSWIEARIRKESREAEECMAKAIREKLDKSNTAMIKAIADTMIKEEKAREKADAELIARVAKLETELAELRGAAAAQRANPAASVAEERRRAGALTRARQEIERLRAAGLKCDGDARDLDLGRVRGAFDEWRH